MAEKRTAEERIALIDAKIAKIKEDIKELEARKKRILNPVSYRSVITAAKEADMSADEISEKLGL